MGCRGCVRPRRQLDVSEVAEVLPRVFDELATVGSDLEGKQGCMVCVLDKASHEFVVESTVVGQVADAEKLAEYTRLCQEKALRLLGHPDHILSWQSRDEDHDQWGGAYDDGIYIWSVSGLTEAQDEALSLMAAHLCGQIPNGEPRACAEISDNQIILGNAYLFWYHPG